MVIGWQFYGVNCMKPTLRKIFQSDDNSFWQASFWQKKSALCAKINWAASKCKLKIPQYILWYLVYWVTPRFNGSLHWETSFFFSSLCWHFIFLTFLTEGQDFYNCCIPKIAKGAKLSYFQNCKRFKITLLYIKPREKNCQNGSKCGKLELQIKTNPLINNVLKTSFFTTICPLWLECFLTVLKQLNLSLSVAIESTVAVVAVLQQGRAIKSTQ